MEVAIAEENQKHDNAQQQLWNVVAHA